MINCQWSDEELEHHLNAAAKKYIADNNIQLYTINAIDKAIEIGMGKRTNTILQSAFFKLSKRNANRRGCRFHESRLLRNPMVRRVMQS